MPASQVGNRGCSSQCRADCQHAVQHNLHIHAVQNSKPRWHARYPQRHLSCLNPYLRCCNPRGRPLHLLIQLIQQLALRVQCPRPRHSQDTVAPEVAATSWMLLPLASKGSMWAHLYMQFLPHLLAQLPYPQHVVAQVI